MGVASRSYLDFNATAPLRPVAIEAMRAAMESFGNPSSVHAEGRAARARVEDARRAVANLAGAAPAEVIFTSGATESAALALTPALFGGRAGEAQLGIFALEHVCVLKGHRFDPARTALLPGDAGGRLDLAALSGWIAAHEGRPLLLALQAANNETGVIQPLAEAAALVRQAGGLIFCDAVQAAGRMPIDILDADFIALSAHKLGGPKGVGALVARGQRLPPAAAFMPGGQERGLRAGTENVIGIAGFGAAAEAAAAQVGVEAARLAGLRAAFEAELVRLDPKAHIFGSAAPRLCNTSCFALPGCAAETLLMALDLGGVALSSGAACSSGKVKASHVLEGMGVTGDLVSGALRMSLGWASQPRDVERGLEVLGEAVKTLRARRMRSAA